MYLGDDHQVCADHIEPWWLCSDSLVMGPRRQVSDRDTGSHPPPGDREGLVNVSAAEEPAMYDEHMKLVQSDSILPAVSQRRFLVVGFPGFAR